MTPAGAVSPSAPLARFLADRAALWTALDRALARRDAAATHPAIRPRFQAQAEEIAGILKGTDLKGFRA